MFNFGVFLCYLAVPTPLLMGVLMVVDLLGWPFWTVAAVPAGMVTVGMSLMALDDY